MKRSEMVKILHDSLVGRPNWEITADEILSILESEGMMPPWSNINCHPDYPLDAYIWETENE